MLSAAQIKRRDHNRKRLVNGERSFQSGERVRAASKKCSICKTVKAATEFYKSNTNKDGLHGWCKACSDQRTVENGRKRLHGLTPEAFQAMHKAQDGLCSICRTDEPTAGKRSFCVDHDHITGKVRGLLCTRCNTMLGNALDDVKILKAAIVYLEKGK